MRIKVFLTAAGVRQKKKEFGVMGAGKGNNSDQNTFVKMGWELTGLRKGPYKDEYISFEWREIRLKVGKQKSD